MKSALLDLLKRQSFQPFFWSILINPFFFIRRGLCHGIRKNQKYLTGHMLDFGCGRKPYKNLFSVDRYTGVDIEVSGHSHELSEVDVYYDGKVLPFPDNTFDSFFCSEVVEHIFNLDSILAEIKRVLKPGAKGLLTVPFAWPEHEVPYDFGRYTSFALPLILKKHGFRVISLDKSGHFTESLLQLTTLYLYTLLSGRSRLWNVFITFICLFPIHLVGGLLTFVLPKNKDLYHNLIVVVERVE